MCDVFACLQFYFAVHTESTIRWVTQNDVTARDLSRDSSFTPTRFRDDVSPLLVLGGRSDLRRDIHQSAAVAGGQGKLAGRRNYIARCFTTVIQQLSFYRSLI